MTFHRAAYFLLMWAFALLAGFAFSRRPLWWAEPVALCGGFVAACCGIGMLPADTDKRKK